MPIIALARSATDFPFKFTIPYSVTIDPGPKEPDHSPDSWLEVSGSLNESEDGWVLLADEVHHVSEPRDPYLY